MSTAPASKTIPLAYPVEHDGGTLTEIVLRRPRGRDVMAMQDALAEAGAEARALAPPSLTDAAPAPAMTALSPKAAMAVSFALVASMNDVSPDVIADLDMEDIGKVTAALGDFFPAVLGKVPAG